MEPNKFEHSAKLLLDEFSIQPTEKVWNTIQPQIQHKKRNNKFAAIFIVLITVFLLSNFNLYDLVNYTTSKNQQVVAARPTTSNIKNDSIDTTSTHLTFDNKRYLDINNVAKNTIKNKNLVNKLSLQRLTKNTRPLNSVAASTNKLKNNNSDLPISSNGLAVEEVTNENSKSSKIDQAIENTAIAKNDSLKTVTDIVELTQSKQQPIAKDAEVATKIATNKSKKWLWSISATAGISEVNKGLFKQSNSVFLGSIDFNNTTGSGTPASSDLFSTSIQPNFGFSFGAQVQYMLSNKSALLFGIQYSYISNRIKVTTIPNALFSNNSRLNNALLVNGYTNQFHCIELPFAYVYSVKKNNHTSWQFQVGGSIAQLVHSNALQLTEDQGVFYKDNSILHKSFFSTNASVLYNLTKKSKAPFLIGPSYSLYLIPLSSKGLYNQVHTSLLGIKVQKYLSKK